ncbi:MAG: hypothetical protein AAGB51_07500 [Planctomycetota bacterium]
MIRFALLTVVGLATSSQAQVFEIVCSPASPDVSSGPVVVNFSLFLNTQGNETGIDVGGTELVDFYGWSGFNGVFRATGGTFNIENETDDDASGGTVLFGAFEGTVSATDWRGRRPGIASVNGSDADFGPPFGIIGGQISDNGNDGSFRFSNVSGELEVRDGGLTLGTVGGGNISGAQSPTAVGGTGQITDSRIEIFRGSITYDESDAGTQSIIFDGLASFFVEPGLTGFTSVALPTIKIPSPSVLGALVFAGLGVRRRR